VSGPPAPAAAGVAQAGRGPAAASTGAALGGPPLASPAPFSLTASHFAVALVFLVAGAAGLVWVAPDLAAGRFLVPRVAAVTHLFTLGWITTSIMGAFYQLFPVVLGTRVRWYGLGHGSLALHAPGLALLVAGLVTGIMAATLAGALLLTAGLSLFVVNAVAGMLRAPVRDGTWRTVAAALAFLVVTVVLGASLAGNLKWFYLGANRLQAVGVHMHVALGGWVLLVVVGVGRKLLPMFLLSHDCDQRPGAAAAILVAAGAGVLTLFHHVRGPVVPWVAALLLAGGAAAFLFQAFLYIRRSHRPELDPGLRLAAAGVAFLGVSIVLGLTALAAGFAQGSRATTYGAALVVGAFSLFVAGHYYKILPFLVWNHRYAGLVGRGRPVPRVAELYSVRTAGVAAGLLIGGATALVICIGAGWSTAARGAAALFAAGVLVETTQMVSLFRSRPQ
jgi:hypothetical protein